MGTVRTLILPFRTPKTGVELTFPSLALLLLFLFFFGGGANNVVVRLCLPTSEPWQWPVSVHLCSCWQVVQVWAGFVFILNRLLLPSAHNLGSSPSPKHRGTPHGRPPSCFSSAQRLNQHWDELHPASLLTPLPTPVPTPEEMGGGFSVAPQNLAPAEVVETAIQTVGCMGGDRQAHVTEGGSTGGVNGSRVERSEVAEIVGCGTSRKPGAPTAAQLCNFASQRVQRP